MNDDSEANCYNPGGHRWFGDDDEECAECGKTRRQVREIEMRETVVATQDEVASLRAELLLLKAHCAGMHASLGEIAAAMMFVADRTGVTEQVLNLKSVIDKMAEHEP